MKKESNTVICIIKLFTYPLSLTFIRFCLNQSLLYISWGLIYFLYLAHVFHFCFSILSAGICFGSLDALS